MKQIHKYPKHIQELYEKVLDAEKQLRVAVCEYEAQNSELKSKQIEEKKFMSAMRKKGGQEKIDRRVTVKYLREFYKEYAYYICQTWCESEDALIRDVGYMPGPDYKLVRNDPSKLFMPGNCYWKRRN